MSSCRSQMFQVGLISRGFIDCLVVLISLSILFSRREFMLNNSGLLGCEAGRWKSKSLILGGLLVGEDEGSTILLRNVGKYSHHDTASHLRRRVSLAECCDNLHAAVFGSVDVYF